MLRNCRKVPKIISKSEIYQFIYIYNKTLAPWKESDNKSKQHIKGGGITLPIKVCIISYL